MKRRREWPPWWEWELYFGEHLLERMEDRRFTEVELRRMMEYSTGYRRDVVKGRWVIETRHRGRRWEVIVEPDPTVELLDVITTYPVREKKK